MGCKVSLFQRKELDIAKYGRTRRIIKALQGAKEENYV